MSSELELLRQRISELETKNAKLEAEKAELLKQVMERDAKRDAENTELKSRVGELEARLAILEQGVTEATGQPQNDKDAIAEVQLSIDNPVSADDSVVDQQNSVNTKVIEDKEIDSFYPEEPASSKLPEEKKVDTFLDKVNKKKVSNEIRKRKREKKLQDNSSPEVTSQREPDSETLVASLDSAIPLNEKNGQGCSSFPQSEISRDKKNTLFLEILITVHHLNHVMLLLASNVMRGWENSL